MKSNSLTILMADDDFEDMELVETALSDVNPSVRLHKFSSGREALDFLADQPSNKLPCLIILDYNMPEIKGSELLSIMRKEERYNEIPKIVLSTSSAPIHIHECMSSGATAYMVKPHSLSEMNKLAQKMLSYCHPIGK